MKNQYDDMRKVRALLRFIWQQYDLNGELFGRSPRCKALEFAIELLDKYFDTKSNEFFRLFDSNSDEALDIIEDYIMELRYKETLERM